MYKRKKGDGKTMAALVVACVIGSVAGFIWGICDLPSIDDIFKRAAEFALIFIFLAVSGVISFIGGYSSDVLIPSQARQKRREGVTTRKSNLKIKRVSEARFFHAEISTKAKLLENGIITIDIMKNY